MKAPEEKIVKDEEISYNEGKRGYILK